VGNRNFDLVLEIISTIVHEDMNASLTAVVTLEEVKRAVFQLCPLSAPGLDNINAKFFSSTRRLFSSKYFQ